MRRQLQILPLLIFAAVRALLRCGADCEDFCSSNLWVLVPLYCVCVCVFVCVCLMLQVHERYIKMFEAKGADKYVRSAEQV